MTLDTKAGLCKWGHRHTWSPLERTHKRGAFSTQVEVWCEVCPRTRVIVYGKRGNHVAGYYNRDLP